MLTHAKNFEGYNANAFRNAVCTSKDSEASPTSLPTAFSVSTDPSSPLLSRPLLPTSLSSCSSGFQLDSIIATIGITSMFMDINILLGLAARSAHVCTIYT